MTAEERAARRRFEELLDRSSLGHLWVECRVHARQPVDPFVPGHVCLLCVTKAHGLSGMEHVSDAETSQ